MMIIFVPLTIVGWMIMTMLSKKEKYFFVFIHFYNQKRIIIELHKLINAQKDESFKAENVDCTFGEFSFDLRIKNFQGKNYRLEIKDLAQEILPNESHVKQYRSKISVSLKKKNKDESWDSLKK